MLLLISLYFLIGAISYPLWKIFNTKLRLAGDTDQKIINDSIKMAVAWLPLLIMLALILLAIILHYFDDGFDNPDK